MASRLEVLRALSTGTTLQSQDVEQQPTLAEMLTDGLIAVETDSDRVICTQKGHDYLCRVILQTSEEAFYWLRRKGLD